MRWPWQSKPKLVQHDIVIKPIPFEIEEDINADMALFPVFPTSVLPPRRDQRDEFIPKDRVPTGVVLDTDGKSTYAPEDGLPLVNQFRKEPQNV